MKHKFYVLLTVLVFLLSFGLLAQDPAAPPFDPTFQPPCDVSLADSEHLTDWRDRMENISTLLNDILVPYAGQTKTAASTQLELLLWIAIADAEDVAGRNAADDEAPCYSWEVMSDYYHEAVHQAAMLYVHISLGELIEDRNEALINAHIAALENLQAEADAYITLTMSLLEAGEQ